MRWEGVEKGKIKIKNKKKGGGGGGGGRKKKRKEVGQVITSKLFAE